jgi:hypothetical protein
MLPEQENHRKAKARLLSLSFLGVVIFHTLLTFYFERPSVILSDEPLRGEDFDIHFGQVTRFIDAYTGWGQIWSYDPSILAGQPEGAICDANTKAWEIWTLLLWKAGLSRGLAFNLFALLSYLMLPVVTFFSARLFGLSRWAAIIASFIMSIIWFFDSQTHNFSWIGMTAWVFASYFSLLPLGSFYRFVLSPSASRALSTALLLATCLLIHPYSFVVLALPMGYLAIRAFRRFTAVQRIWIFAIALFAIAANGFWLLVAWRFWHYVINSGYFSQTRISTLLLDFLELAENPGDTSLFMRTGFRFLVFGAALIMLVLWRRSKDDRLMIFALGIGWLIGIAYFGSYFWIFSQVQPYRYIVPATMFAVIPATCLIVELYHRGVYSRFTWLSWALIGLIALPGLQLVARDILVYFPPLLQFRGDPLKDKRSIGTISGYPTGLDLRHQKTGPGDLIISRWITAYTEDNKRVLVEPPLLGEWLPYQVKGIEVLGGFLQRNLLHTEANYFRRFPNRTGSAAELRKYLETYGVQWVILSPEIPFPMEYRGLLSVRAKLPGATICKTNIRASYFQQGTGRVSASMNRIDVRDTRPEQELVLRYHWLETLSCKPDCHIEKEPLPDDAVGFIRVSVPHPKDFLIFNSYRFN